MKLNGEGMINLVELNRQKRYIKIKRELESLKSDIVDIVTDSAKEIDNITKKFI